MKTAYKAYLDFDNYEDAKNYFNECVSLMDAEIRERIHRAAAPCSDDLFLSLYCIEHKREFDEEFIIN